MARAIRAIVCRSISVNTGATSYVCTLAFTAVLTQSPTIETGSARP